jgi:RND family efflux transporter MFP subunit
MTTIPPPPRHLATRVLLPLSIVGAAAALLAVTGWRSIVPLPEAHVLPVLTREAKLDAPSAPAEGAPVQAPGWVEPAPYAIGVRALASGVVREVLALEGQRVAAGEVMARLFDEEQRIAVAQAEAALAEAVARRDEMADELARKRKIVDKGAASAGEVARLARRVEAMDASVKSAAAALSMARLTLERAEVRAPAGGIVMARRAAPGTSVGMADAMPLFELYDPDELQVRADVPLAEVGPVGVGDRAEVRVDAFPDRTMRGEVTRFVHQADVAKNTVQVKIRLDDPVDGLKPDMLARVRVFPRGGPAAGGEARPVAQAVTCARAECIAQDEAGARVRAIAGIDGGIGTVEERAVRVAGPAVGGWVPVSEGLRASDLLLRADDPLRPGTRVRVADDWREAAARKEADHGGD